MKADIQTLNERPEISKQLQLDFFDNPPAEVVMDQNNSADMLAEIVARFEPEEPEEAPAIVPKIPISEALSALATLTLYKNQQVDGDVSMIRAIELYRRTIKGRQLRSHRVQTSIDSFLR